MLVLNWQWLCPSSRGHLVKSRNIFGGYNWRVGLLLASTGWRPGILLNILQCTGRPHDKGLSGPKCQWCWGWEALSQGESVDREEKRWLCPRALSWRELEQELRGRGEAWRVGCPGSGECLGKEERSAGLLSLHVWAQREMTSGLGQDEHFWWPW